MHLIDESVGFMGSTAIVGNTIPIGVGLNSQKIAGSHNLTYVFLGDGKPRRVSLRITPLCLSSVFTNYISNITTITLFIQIWRPPSLHEFEK